MDEPIDESSGELERFRSYLHLLVRTHLGAGNERDIEASDLVQQTLLDAHAKRAQCQAEGAGQFAAWLRRILLNNVADALRRRGRAKRDVARQVSLEAAVEESFRRAHDWLMASQSSPSQHAVKEEQLLEMAAALEQLPAAQRDAIVLHHLQGLSLAAVAERLGRSQTAVAGLLYRGLKSLHELMEKSP